MNTRVLMVQMEDHKWTTAALHEACQEAQKSSAKVALALLLPQSHCILANIDPAHYIFSETERDELTAYRAIAANYGVNLEVHVFAYNKLREGILEAADALQADTVWTHLPGAFLPMEHDRQVHQLENMLESHRHHLRNFEPPVVSSN